MSLITPTYETQCSNCNTIVKYLRFGETDLVCETCFIESEGKRLKGASKLVPCSLCVPPNIRWYTKKMLRKAKKDCGMHNIDSANY